MMEVRWIDDDGTAGSAGSDGGGGGKVAVELVIEGRGEGVEEAL